LSGWGNVRKDVEGSQVREAARSRRPTMCFAKFQWALAVALLGVPVLPGQAPDLQDELRAAAAAEQSGRYEEAAALYQRLLSGNDSPKTDPAISVHVRTRLATVYFLLHRYRESLEAVAPLTSKNSGYAHLTAQAWLVEGLDQLELGQVPQAIVSLRQTLALNPESGTARLALGDALARSGHMEKAAREYEEQTRRTPSLPDAWYKLGLAYAQLATHLTQDFEQRLPESILGQQLAAEDRLEKGDYLGAAGAFFRLLRHAPSQPQAHADLGATLLDLGYPKAAEDQFHLELSQNPHSPLARLGLAETAALRSDWEEAISDIEVLARSHPHELARLLELSPPGLLLDAWTKGKIQVPQRLATSPAGLLWQAWLSDSASRPTMVGPEVSASCSNPSPKAMTRPGLWLEEACYQRLRDRLRAKKALRLEERIKLAEAEFRLGHYQTARREAQRLLESNPRNEWGIFWLSQSNGELAEECFAKVASLNPESARVHQMLGQYYASHHNFPRAKSEFLAAIRLAPELPDLHLSLGTVYREGGEWPEAEKELQRTLELAPGSALAHYELGDTYVEQRRWEPAVDHLRHALEDPALAVKARLDLAKAEAEMGQPRQAIEELLPVLKEDKDGEIHYRLADLYRKLGERARAQEALATFRRIRDASLQADRAELQALEKERERAEKPNMQEPPR
jgi:tetratricopeptide (TPR) repeat protein